MNKNEQDMIQKIKEKSEQVPVPEALKPRQIEAKLAGKKKKKWTLARIGALSAACLVLVAGVVIYQNNFRISGSSDSYQPAKNNVTISDSKIVESASEYEDVYAYINKYKMDQESASASTSSWARTLESTRTDEAADSAANEIATQNVEESSSAGAASAGAMDTGTYSETNVRQEGVDEGDTAKTDGTYLYVLKDKSDEIAIVDTRENKMKQTASISVENISEIREIYLDLERNQLVAVCDGYAGGKLNDDDYNYGQESNTTAVTYDISDRANPKEVGRVSQSGYYNSSRVVDGYLYLFSDYYVTLGSITVKDPKSYVPLVNDNLIKETDICLPSISKADMYSIITSVSLDKPDETAHSKALLADSGNLYVSNNNIYYYETVWSYSEKQTTTIRKVSYENGKLTAGAQCKLDGYINDSFSIDEYQGYLRVVMTENATNSVYVLDKELKETGSIKNLAKDERVYSARFMGDVGYFVTFKETDPLFSVDLSDPKNPKIIGELKIPGFSDYLHPYGKDKLLGIGMDVDEKTMSTDGVKLTMFDISDPENVKEEQTYVIENVYYTDVSYDYKAALVDTEKNLIGFAADSEGGREYYTFSYDAKQGFECTMHEEINGNNMRITRGIYIEDTLYVIQGNIIEAYSLKDFKKVDDIIL